MARDLQFVSKALRGSSSNFSGFCENGGAAGSIVPRRLDDSPSQPAKRYLTEVLSPLGHDLPSLEFL